jgi:hypothetical protein
LSIGFLILFCFFLKVEKRNQNNQKKQVFYTGQYLRFKVLWSVNKSTKKWGGYRLSACNWPAIHLNKLSQVHIKELRVALLFFSLYRSAIRTIGVHKKKYNLTKTYQTQRLQCMTSLFMPILM